MNDRLEDFLKITRSALNRRIVLVGALRWAIRSALVSAVAIAALILAGFSFSPLLPWATLTLLGSLWGAFRSRKRLLDSRETARWLDARYGNGELLSAALFCAGRGQQGPFDSAVIAQATAFIDVAPTLRPSRSILAKQAAFALVTLLILPLGLSIIPSPRDGSMRERGDRATAAGAEAAARPLDEAAGELDGRSPESIARSLFPDERRLAAIAERAIREGRLDDLKDILNRTELDYRDRIKRANSALERSRLAEELEEFRKRGREALAQNQTEQGGGNESDEAKRPSGAAAAGQSAANRQRRPGANAGATTGENGDGENQAAQAAQRQTPWAGGGANRDQPGNNQPNDGTTEGKPGGTDASANDRAAQQAAANKAGSEGSGDKMDWGQMKGASSGEKLLKDNPERDRQFELVMSGESPTVADGTFTVSSGRVAEAAVAREAAPRDYEEYIRSYFISLSKLVNSADKPAEDGLGGKGVQQ